MDMVWYKKISEDKYGDVFRTKVLVHMNKEWDFDNPIKMIEEGFTYNCSHEWDCCGCVQTEIEDIMSCGGKYYLVFLHNYRNI
jgi:hypothetical protein